MITMMATCQVGRLWMAHTQHLCQAVLGVGARDADPR